MGDDTLGSFKLLESKIEEAANMITRVKAEKKKLVDENKLRVTNLLKKLIP